MQPAYLDSGFAIIRAPGRLDQPPAPIPFPVALMRVAEIAPAFVGGAGRELACHAEMRALVGELGHEVAQAQRGIDPAPRDVLLVGDDPIHDAWSRRP